MGRAWVLVDRDRELDQLVDLVKRSLAGSGEFAVIEGPAGIGKSRLLREVLIGMEESGAGLLTARCSQLEQDATFGAIRRLVEPIIVGSPASKRAELFAGAAAPAAGMFSDGATGWDVGSEFGALHALYWLMANLSDRRPLILVVDDIHWCDGPSLRFLAYLVHRTADLPIAVLMAARPADPGDRTRLLDHLATEEAGLVLRLEPLSERSSSRLLAAELGDEAHPAFLEACYRATVGNPLLLGELVDLLADDGMTPTADNARAITAVGSASVSRWVRNRLAPLERNLVAVAEAVAVLGGPSDTRSVYGVAEVSLTVGLDATDQLCRANIVRQCPAGTGGVEFVHPLVREAIYNGLDGVNRSRKHALAVEVLTANGHDIEDVAAHVLLTQHETSPPALTVLRAAARQAASRGAPDGAVVYLRQCLNWQLPERERVELLIELGAIAQLVDLAEAADFLGQARKLVGSGPRAAEVAGLLGSTLMLMGDSQEAAEVMQQAIAAVEPDSADLRHRLEAMLLNIRILDPTWQYLAADRPLQGLTDHDAGIGTRMMAAVLSVYETFSCNPLGPVRAESALAGDVLVREISGEGPLACAWLSMLAADDHRVMRSLDAAIAHAHRFGSTRGVGVAYSFRGLGWLWQGQLREAEADLTEAREAVDASHTTLGRLFTGPHLAEVLAAQGRLAQAREALDWVTGGQGAPTGGPRYFYMLANAKLLRLCGDPGAGLQAALLCGERDVVRGGENPAVAPWRTEAALCLGELGSAERGLAFAVEELAMARRWGAPRPLGRALRVAGMLTGGVAGLALLQESIEILDGAKADLERTESLLAYGTRLNSLQRATEAKYFLRKGLELAEICGANGLIAAGRRELTAAGARPRNLAMSGVRSLTPSERRVARRAADGLTNREIAQALFITAKTVEIHLTAAYRKLNVSGRDNLAAVLDE